MKLEDRFGVVADLCAGSDGLLRLLGDLERFGTPLAQLEWTGTRAGATARLELAGSPAIGKESLIARLARHPSVKRIALECSKADA
jgi:hypothetical protein